MGAPATTTKSSTWLSVEQVCDTLGVSRSTWDKWVSKGCAPRAKRLPNGSLRVFHRWLDEWLEALPEVGD